MSAPLNNVRVLEIGRVYAAPWAGQMLADLGAEVIKVEATNGGDMTRGLGTGVVKDADGNPTSDHSLFAALNRNKKSIAVDLAHPDGQVVVKQLVKKCDVFIENFKVGDLERRNLHYEEIKKHNPNIVYLSLTGFGQTGPYRKRPGMDDVVQGLCGFKALNGMLDGPPVGSPISIMDFSAGMHAAVGILAALYARDTQGAPGQYIDLSLLDSAMALMSYKLVAFMNDGIQEKRGQRTRGYTPGGVMQTKDGFMQCIIGPNWEFERLCNACGREDLLDDPRFNDRWARHENFDIVQSTFVEIYKTKTTQEWCELLTSVGLMASPVNDFDDALADPQIVAREVVKEITHELGGNLKLIKNPIQFSTTPISEYRSPPLYCQHTDSILTELAGLSTDEIAKLKQDGAVK